MYIELLKNCITVIKAINMFRQYFKYDCILNDCAKIEVKAYDILPISINALIIK